MQHTAIVLSCLSFLFLSGCASSGSWRTASRESMGIAPLPEDEKEALVQVYVARAYSWRKYFAVHSWLATKDKNAKSYVVYQVTAWGMQSLQVEEDMPDRRWFGADAYMIASLKGEKAEAAIRNIKAAVETYPYPKDYRIFPGPNSNTFVSYVLRRTPEIGVELPTSAIGRDWLNEGDLFGSSESRTGFQFSLLGVFGFTLGLGDGVEVNILGLGFGVDILRPAIKLPFVGRLGFSDQSVF